MQRGVWAVSLGGLVTLTPAAASPRFFASTNQCESARLLPPGACKTAFANAMAEFAARAPSFRNRRACYKQFGPCMPWPIGSRRYNEFRPQWIGTTIEADMVLPAVAPGRLHLGFTPQSLAALSPAAQTTAAAPARARGPEVTIMTPHDDAADDAAGPAPRAGSGFTMIDGVMTYPAPARFQPKTLKHP